MTTNIKIRQLKLILNDFELLSRTAITQFQIAAKLLQDSTIDSLYEEAEANEIIMDRLEVKIREEVVFSIFQFSPKASDLRQIIAYQDATHNLERIGDVLLNVIHFTKQTDLSLPHFEEIKKKIEKMVKYTGEMLNNAVFSFSNEDGHTAYQVIEEDDKVDELFHRISDILRENFINRSLTQAEMNNIININAIAHNLERIGDSATNMAEATIYLTEGKDIRHGNKN